MKVLQSGCVMLLVAGLCGCSSSGPAASARGQSSTATSGGDLSSAASSSAASAGNSESTGANTPDNNNADMPIPPEGAQFTMLCQAFTGPAHIVDAKRLKDTLIQHTGLKDWYVLHSEDESDLYYGFYKTYDDRSQSAEYSRAQQDHSNVASLLDSNGQPIFSQVIFVPLSLPDPPAPAEWEISHNPGYWTLEIAVYKDSPQRKQAAVDAVKAARAEGVPAYYHHELAQSMVFVGSWPKGAVKEQEAASAATDDPNQPLLVLSGPIAGAENAVIRTPDGRPYKVVMPKVEITDPTLKAAIAKYPNFYVNGEAVGHNVQSVNGTIKLEPYPSYLMEVPHGNEEAVSGDHSDSGAPGDAGAGDAGAGDTGSGPANGQPPAGGDSNSGGSGGGDSNVPGLGGPR
jgi:hypothetical protein